MKMAIAICSVAMTVLGALADTEIVNGITWTYTVENGCASIGGGSYSTTAVPSSTAGDIVIPSLLGGCQVTSIGNYAFGWLGAITSVEIPAGVTSIGELAFCGCSGLTSVMIPDSVTSIGVSTFSDCSGLASVYITDIAAWCRISFFSASSNPLSYAHKLYINGEKADSLTIPNGVTSIRDYTFYGCSGLTSVTIPDSVTSIGDYAFGDCSGLTSMTIPDSVTNIGYRVFYACSGLTSVMIPKSVTSLSTDAFDGCGRLWAAWYRTLANSSAAGAGGSPSSYVLTNAVADRAIASVTVDDDCAIDEFVLKDGMVYDSVVRIVNTSGKTVKLTLPDGFDYETFKGAKPLMIPAKSRNILTITRTEDRTFFVSRKELETVE